jgi:hypothetical protein
VGQGNQTNRTTDLQGSYPRVAGEPQTFSEWEVLVRPLNNLGTGVPVFVFAICGNVTRLPQMMGTREVENGV